MPKKPRNDLKDRVGNAVFMTLLAVVRRLPFHWRLNLTGWLVAWVVGPLVGYMKRAEAHLAYACPELPEQERKRIARAACDNAGRAMIEQYFFEDVYDRVADIDLSGPGIEALDAAQAAGKPAVVISGHFGSYAAVLCALKHRGVNVGAIYRPMNNPYFDKHYVKAIKRVVPNAFPRGRDGFQQLLAHARDGNTIGLLMDQYMAKGEDLTFFGQTAPTALTAAELALKFDAPLICLYGVRKPNRLDYDIVVDAPIPHTDPMTMTQAINDSLEAITRQHMEQWFWIHRRWKPHRAKYRQPKDQVVES